MFLSRGDRDLGVAFHHLMGRANSFEKTLRLGKIEGGRRRDNKG